MQSKYSNPTESGSNPSTQASALSGFQFTTIGHSPSLLERMSDGPRVSFRLRPSDQNSFQEQNGTSHASFRPNQAQPMAMRVPLVERGSSVKPILTQDLNSLPSTSALLSPSETTNDVKAPQPLDQIPASVIPDLQYPNPTPEIESPLWESTLTHPQPHLQPIPMDQDASHPVPRTLPAPASIPPVGPVVVGELTDSSTLSSQTTSSQHSSSAASSTEPEQLRSPIEHLFRIASVREEGLSKRRETFDRRSGELSTFGTDASRAIQDLQNKTETLKQHAEEMRTQAELTLREATKMRDMAELLIVSAGTLGVELLGAKNHVGRTVERSEQLSRYVRKSFDWLANLRSREQEKIAVIQAEIAEQERAELLRRQQELQQQLERRKIEEQEKMEAAKREEEAREAARMKAEEEREAARKKAEEEREAARKKVEEEREAARKVEEEREAARKKSYEIRRAEVLADKWRATEAQAQSIQAERERRIADASSSSSRPSARGSNAPLSTSPAPTLEVAHSARASTDVPRATVPTPSRSPVARTGRPSETTPPFSSPEPLPNRVKTIPAHVSFVPAQTEAGRAVNTDSPLSSTTLASELHPRNVVEAPRHSYSSQILRDFAEEEMLSQRLGQAAPTLEPRQVEIKREPSVGELPRPQPLPDSVNTDHSRDHQPMPVPRTPSQDGNMDQHALPTSTSGSRATSLHVPQTEDHRYLMGMSAQDDLHHLQDSPRDHLAPDTDGRVYARQRSVSSDRSMPPWNYRDQRSRTPLSSRDDRSRSPSRSPPYRRKRTRSRSPPRFVDHWELRPRMRPRVDDDWERTRRYNGYERRRQGDSYRGPPPRRAYDYYRPSPPPSPRQFRNERSPLRRTYYDRSLAAEHVPQRYVDTDAREWRADDPRTNVNVNARHPEPTYEGAEAYRTAEKEEPQHQRQRRSSSPSERDQTSTSSPRHGEVEIGLLDRINMNVKDDRGHGRGRPLPGAARGGPNTRRGSRGFSSGRGRGSAPALLSRMSETAARPVRPTPALSLSDRMEQD